jgi:hypothetical protein
MTSMMDNHRNGHQLLLVTTIMVLKTHQDFGRMTVVPQRDTVLVKITTVVITNVLKDTPSGEPLKPRTFTQVQLRSNSLVESGLLTLGMENSSLLR